MQEKQNFSVVIKSIRQRTIRVELTKCEIFATFLSFRSRVKNLSFWKLKLRMLSRLSIIKLHGGDLEAIKSRLNYEPRTINQSCFNITRNSFLMMLSDFQYDSIKLILDRLLLFTEQNYLHICFKLGFILIHVDIFQDSQRNHCQWCSWNPFRSYKSELKLKSINYPWKIQHFGTSQKGKIVTDEESLGAIVSSHLSLLFYKIYLHEFVEARGDFSPLPPLTIAQPKPISSDFN